MTAVTHVGPSPRLTPIERPRGLLQWLLRFYFRARFGKVMMPLRVLYPRIPRFGLGQLGLVLFAQYGLSLPRPLSHRIAIRVSQQNGCDFCGDLERAAAMDAGHGGELDDEDLGCVSDPTAAAALRYADEVVRTHDASDATFAELARHFDERQIAEIVWLVAFTCYHNLMAKPLRLSSDGFCAIVAKRRRGAREPSTT